MGDGSKKVEGQKLKVPTFHFLPLTCGDDLDLRLKPDAEFLIDLLFAEFHEEKNVGRRCVLSVQDEIRMFCGDHGAAMRSAGKAAFSDEFCRRDHGDRVGFHRK